MEPEIMRRNRDSEGSEAVTVMEKLIEVWRIVSGNKIRAELKRIDKAADKIIKGKNGQISGENLKIVKPAS